MANATRSQLEQAYTLIQQDNLDQAIAILKPITAREPNNADAWWLMANAVSEPHDAHEALQNVLRLNPANDQARELLQQLEKEFPQLGGGMASPVASASDFGDSDSSFDDLFGSTAKPTKSTGTGGSSFSSDDLDELLGDSSTSSGGFPSGSADDLFNTNTLDNSQPLDSFFESSPATFGSSNDSFSSFDDPFASGEPGFVQDDVLNAPRDKQKPARGRAAPKPRRAPKEILEMAPNDPLELERRANSRPNPMAIVVLLILILAIVGVGVFAAINAGLIGGNKPAATSAPSAVMVIPANDVPAAIQALTTQLTGKGFGAVSASVVVSPLIGDTFQVQLCDKATADLAKKITTVQDLVAQAAAALRSTVKGAGIDIVSCANPSVRLYRAVSPIDAVTSYVDGGLKDKQTFKASWQKS